MIPDPTSLLSKAINEALSSDPANGAYLKTLGDLCIQVTTETPPTSFNIYIQNGAISISVAKPETGKDPDIHISGTALNLAKLLASKMDNAAALRRADIRVEGDIALLLELTQIAEKIDIDWEAILAEKIGEAPAVIFSRGFTKVKQASTGAFESQRSAFEIWLKHPDSPLPTREDHETLKTNLRQMHYRLDRLDALRKQQNKKVAENR